jgi:hypothetical protein
MGPVEGEGLAVEKGIKKTGGDRGKGRYEGTVGGEFAWCLCFSVLSCLGGMETHQTGEARREVKRRGRIGRESVWWR